ncbi:hypothetical protein [Alicyclobacillus ferrooxydans]|uniref:Uncharacterized protein n=1 Tax=Alicyclobacillus ferrooxydans TaxID=471514 RepID=A0A0N8PPK4_9BACL|nr:hypothetical protein [Alicyclobacillus ferrooxydans]KPV44573.1 hypothetical protein AN477_06120 [Alicyclobacillus ferrooxydans]
MNQVNEVLQEVLELWKRMKTSEMDDAADDADRFQMMFYAFVDHVADFVRTLPKKPADADEARLDPNFAPLFNALPEPLQIPFETELDAILAEAARDFDNTEQ